MLGFVALQEGEGPARSAARKALELDPGLPDSHDAWSTVLNTFDRNGAAAEKEERRALELDPNFIDALNDYSYLLITMGRFAEALPPIERAAALDHLNSGLHITWANALMGLKRVSEAEQHFQQALDLDPQSPVAARRLLAIAEQTGDAATVLRRLEQGKLGGNALQSPQAGRVYAKLGRRADALRVLQGLTAPGSRANPVDIASVYEALGDNDRCFEWLGKAVDGRMNVGSLKADPRFAGVRADPRFRTLLQRAGVSE